MMRDHESGDQPAIKVLYIVGFPRSGSTLLERLLGEEARLFSAGEVRRLWERGFIGDELCSCGQRFHTCSFWPKVIQEAFGEMDGVNAEAMASTIADLDGRRTRWGEIRRRLTPGNGSSPRPSDAVLLALYRAILSVSRAPALVDSSKDPTYALMLTGIPGIELDIVHLVRDSRAVAYSWQRRRRRPEIVDREEFMPLVRPRGSAVGWDFRNLSAETLRSLARRYVRVRYEDLVANPGAELCRILDGLHRPHPGLEHDGGPDPSSLYHTVSGNPSRLTKGNLRVTPDIEWMSSMKARDRFTVTALTFPLLLRYGYRLSPTPEQVGFR